MTNDLRFPVGSTIYFLKSLVYMMIPDKQNVLQEKWLVSKFISIPYEGCPVPQINEDTNVGIGDILTSIAMCKEIVEFQAIWEYQAINITMTLTIKNNKGRLHFTDPEMQEYVGRMILRFSENPDQFP